MHEFKLNNQTVFVLVEAAGGVYNSDQLRLLCEFADDETAFLKVTEDQRIGFMISEDRLTEVQAKLAQAGLLIRNYQGISMLSPKSCLGELCPHHAQQALGDAIELSSLFAKTFGKERPFVSMGMNGCEKSCLASATDDIHIVGEASGYKISIGGKGSEVPQIAQFLIDNVAQADMGNVLSKVLECYFNNATEGERLWETLDRIGISPFLAGIEGEEESQSDFSLGESLDEGNLEVQGESLADERGEGVEEDESLNLPAADFRDNDDLQLSLVDDDDALDIPLDGLDDDEIIELPPLQQVVPVQSKSPSPSPQVEILEETELSLGDSNHELDNSDLDSDEANLDAGDSNLDSDEANLDAGDSNHALMPEEDFLDLEDGTTEDVERLTLAIRAESEAEYNGNQNELEEEILPLTSDETPFAKESNKMNETSSMPLLDRLRSSSEAQRGEYLPPDDELLDDEAPMSMRSNERRDPPQENRASPKESSHLSPANDGVKQGFRFKIRNNNIELTLPAGAQCSVPLEFVEASGFFEVEIDGKSLSVELLEGNKVQLNYNGARMTLPLGARSKIRDAA